MCYFFPFLLTARLATDLCQFWCSSPVVVPRTSEWSKNFRQYHHLEKIGEFLELSFKTVMFFCLQDLGNNFFFSCNFLRVRKRVFFTRLGRHIFYPAHFKGEKGEEGPWKKFCPSYYCLCFAFSAPLSLSTFRVPRFQRSYILFLLLFFFCVGID